MEENTNSFPAVSRLQLEPKGPDFTPDDLRQIPATRRLEAYVQDQLAFLYTVPPGLVGDRVIEYLSKLRKELSSMTIRELDWNTLQNHKSQLDQLAHYFRSHYQREIEQGKHSRFTNAVEAAIHYMAVERDLAHRGFLGRLKWAVWGV